MHGLALSGGGFRATLFHLGVIRYLYEKNDLSKITHITSVSGGSIAAAHLVLNWDRYTGDEKAFHTVASELISFIKLDIRGRIVRRIPIYFPVYWFSVLLRRAPFIDDNSLGWWTRVSTTDILQRYYSNILFKKKRLCHLEGTDGNKRPKLFLLSTSLDDAEQAAFTSSGFHIGSRDYDCPSKDLGIAVAASSAFPGMFPPVTFKPQQFKDKPVFKLTDGGVFDNLGVRKFWEILAKENINSKAVVIVSDASVEFKPFSRRSFFEPITTPIRSADILFKRVYDLESDLAKQVDDETSKCNFRFLRLRDKLDSKSDDLALLPAHQNELWSTRTDLDGFSDLEIAALVRHGYCVARAKLGNGAAEIGTGEIRNSQSENSGQSESLAQQSPWHPLPASKNSYIRPMLARDLELSERIEKYLGQSSVRRFRFFSFRDWASYLTLFVLLIVLGFLLRPILFPDDPGLLDLRISAAKDSYQRILWDRKVDDWQGFASDAKKLQADEIRQVPLETWTTSQAAYALLRAGNVQSEEVNPGEVAFLANSLESRFLPASPERGGDWIPEAGGWYTRPGVLNLQAEPAIWTLAAISSILQRSDLDSEKRTKLNDRLLQTQQYLSTNRFFIWEGDGLAFNVLANQTVPTDHSAYTTSLALMALLEMRKARIKTWDDKTIDYMIESILRWFERSYDSGDNGWISIAGDVEKEVADDAVNLQILSVMLEAYSDLKKSVPGGLQDGVRKHLTGLEQSLPVNSLARVWRTSEKGGISENHEITINFLWKPWAIRLCRTWLKTLSNSASVEERKMVLALTAKLTNDLSRWVQDDKTRLTFYSAEMLIALS